MLRGRAKLPRKPYRGCWSESEQCAVLFREKRRTLSFPNNIAKYPLGRAAIPLPPYPRLAGTQTALPSVPVPTKVSFVVVPAPFWDSKTFFPGKKVFAPFFAQLSWASKKVEKKKPF
jgi:hypothetical protein